MRLQAAVGRLDAVRRTLALLETRLADLGLIPGASTRKLPPPCWALRHRPAAL